MSGKVVCMASAKGGSGKTVLTNTFGVCLASIGRKVLLVDTDAATNGLTLFYLKNVLMQSDIARDNRRIPCGVYEAQSDVETVSLSDSLDLIPASFAFKEVEAISPELFLRRIQAIMARSRASYDYVFLDAQAGADTFAQICMSRAVSDEVVLVSEYDPMSSAGVERLKGLLRNDLVYPRTWVLLNKLLPDFVRSFNDFLQVARYLSPIPWDAEVVRAYARKTLALDMARGNEHTFAIFRTLTSLLGEEVSDDLQSWKRARAATLLAPLDQRYKDAERELQGLLADRLRFEQRKTLRKEMLRALNLLIALATGYLIYKGGAPALSLPSALSSPMALAAMAIVFLGGGEVLERLLPKAPEAPIEESRLRRRISVLERRLRELEALKSADIDTILTSTPANPEIVWNRLGRQER